MEKIYKDYYSRLLSFINSKIQNDEDAKDILSEVFIKIFTNVDKLDNEQKLTSWIYTITRNTIIDFYRKQNKNPSFIEFDDEKSIDYTQEDSIYDELSKCIEPMINSLDSKYSEVLLLSEIKGLKQKTISEQIGLSPSNTKSIIARGKKQIKEKLYKCCSYEFDSFGNLIDFNEKNKNQNSF